jgi:hypothetical protein
MAARKPKADGLQALMAKQDPVSIQELTMQDFFAAFAMQSFWADPEVVGTQSQAAEWAYEMADEMLKARTS